MEYKQGIFYDIFGTTEKEWDAAEWRERGHELRKTANLGKWRADKRQWLLGDWLIAGEVHFKQAKFRHEARNITGYPWGTLKNLIWVAKAFPPSRRRDKLSWSHHREVAHLPVAKQDEYLDTCNGNQPLKSLKSRVRGGAAQKVGEEYANYEAIRKGEFPLRIKPIQIMFPTHGRDNRQTVYFSEIDTATLLYLYETEQATHGKKSRQAFFGWLIENGLERLGWMPKAKDFVVNWQARRKTMQADVAKRVVEDKARHAAWKAKMDAQKKFTDGLPKDLNHSEFKTRLREWEKDYLAQHEAGGTKESNRESSVEIAEGRP